MLGSILGTMKFWPHTSDPLTRAPPCPAAVEAVERVLRPSAPVPAAPQLVWKVPGRVGSGL